MGCYHHLKVEEPEARTSALAQVSEWWSWDLHSLALSLQSQPLVSYDKGLQDNML